MLMNLHKKSWTHGLNMQRFEDHHRANETTIEVRRGTSLCLLNAYTSLTSDHVSARGISKMFLVSF
jgi:hypothetical protein